MSFILDALKKSEAERRQGDVPKLQNEPGSPKPRRRSFWPLILTLALLLNGAVLGWWLLAREGRTREVEKAAGRGGPVPAPARTADPEPVKRPVQSATPAPRTLAAAPAVPVATVEPSASLPAASAPGSVRIPETADPRQAPASTPKPRPSEEESQAAAPVVFEPSFPSAPSPAADFPPLSELPADVRSGLPGLSLQLHFYSPVPENRLVRLNGVNLREGSKSAGGLIVVEIVPDGVNLSFAGVGFFLPTVRR